MINKIMDAITNNIEIHFNSEKNEIEIITDEIKQGFTEPCFFVSFLEPNYKKLLGNRYQVTYPACVQYISKENNRELNKVAEKLVECMEWITTEDNNNVMGTKLRHKIDDGVLHFFVSYTLHVTKSSQTPKYDMGEIEINISKE